MSNISLRFSKIYGRLTLWVYNIIFLERSSLPTATARTYTERPTTKTRSPPGLITAQNQRSR